MINEEIASSSPRILRGDFSQRHDPAERDNKVVARKRVTALSLRGSLPLSGRETKQSHIIFAKVLITIYIIICHFPPKADQPPADECRVFVANLNQLRNFFALWLSRRDHCVVCHCG